MKNKHRYNIIIRVIAVLLVLAFVFTSVISVMAEEESVQLTVEEESTSGEEGEESSSISEEEAQRLLEEAEDAFQKEKERVEEANRKRQEEYEQLIKDLHDENYGHLFLKVQRDFYVDGPVEGEYVDLTIKNIDTNEEQSLHYDLIKDEMFRLPVGEYEVLSVDAKIDLSKIEERLEEAGVDITDVSEYITTDKTFTIDGDRGRELYINIGKIQSEKYMRYTGREGFFVNDMGDSRVVDKYEELNDDQATESSISVVPLGEGPDASAAFEGEEKEVSSQIVTPTVTEDAQEEPEEDSSDQLKSFLAKNKVFIILFVILIILAIVYWISTTAAH